MNAENHGKLVVLLLLLATVSPPAMAQRMNPWQASPSETVLLPKYCWGQFNSKDFKGPEYTISNCGPFMNHYCLGLLAIVRANRTIGNKPQRLGLLNGAKDTTVQTLKDMKDYPQCPIRKDVEQTLRQVESQLQLLR